MDTMGIAIKAGIAIGYLALIAYLTTMTILELAALWKVIRDKEPR